MLRITSFFAAAVMAVATHAIASPLPFIFDLSPGSGMNVTSTNIVANTAGTLIGDWDPVKNPGGTRTKPGLFGTFGSTENLPVNLTVNLNVTGTPSVPLIGGFFLDVDPVAGTVTMTNYGSSQGTPPTGALALSATITTESFRTRTPDSTYPGGIPVTLPLGDANFTALDVVQDASPAIGTLTPTGPNTYDFAVSPFVTITGTIDLNGTFTDIGPLSGVLPITGSLTIMGNSATITSIATIAVQDAQSPNQALPQFPFALPTVLPPGSTANVLMDLILTQISVALNAQIQNNATGTLVPEPTLGLLIPLALLLNRRGRRAGPSV
jgi:hypothetical protein